MNKTNNYISLFFILLLNMVTYHLFRTTVIQMEQLTPFGNEAHQLLKFWIIPLSSLVFAGIYYTASKKSSVYSLVKKTYAYAIMFVTTYLFIIIPIYLWIQPSVPESASPLLELYTKWVYTSFYIFSALWSPLTILTYYGFINEKISFKDASKLYPILAIFGLILSQVISPTFLPIITNKLIFMNKYLPGLLALGLLSFTSYLYSSIERSSEGLPQKSNYKLGLYFIVMLALFMTSLGFVKQLSYISWDSAVNLQKPLPLSHWQSMAKLSSLKTLSIFITITVLAFLSVFLQQYRVKGWRHFSYTGAIISSIISLTMIFFCFYGDSLGPILPSSDNSVALSTLMKVGSSYQIFVSNVMYPTTLCLTQLLFVAIPIGQRFRFKILADLVFNKTGFFLAAFLHQSIYPFQNSSTTFWFFFGFVFFIGTVGRLTSIYYVGKNLELSEPT